MNYDLTTKEGMNNAVAWTKNALALLRIGGVWGVPRSGVIVRKTGSASVEISDPAADPSIAHVLRMAGFSVNTGVKDE
jgi:hypothetical protein